MTTANLRMEYQRSALDEEDAGDDPAALFHRWFTEAVATGAPDANAMTLATADAEGQPSARIVLCKGYDEHGFVFFTNYESRKGQELDTNPRACLLFYWGALERQVRIAGTVVRVDSEESDRYFSQRPRAARIGAWASPQSQVIQDRSVLERRFEEYERLYPADAESGAKSGAKSGASSDRGFDRGFDGEPPRPPHWGGLRLAPVSIEFWQGRPSRLHDRLLFTRHDGRWERFRLAP